MSDTSITSIPCAAYIPQIIIPLPDHDFDPTECAVPWKFLTAKGWKVSFSTELGNVAQAEPHQLKGTFRDPLGAGAKAIAAYRLMTHAPAFQHPIPYADLDPDQYDAILLPGGHADGMHQYLDSPILQKKVLQFWQQDKPVGAICHGILVLARTIDPLTGRSILYGHKITVLPRSLDYFNYLFNYRLLHRPHLIYDCYVEEEVRACLQRPEDLLNGSSVLSPFVVRDGNLITARWWLEAELFAERFAEVVEQSGSSVAASQEVR